MNRLVPAYALYGESAAARFPDPLHIETIAARSSVHDWRIRPHRHADLWQVFVLEHGGASAVMDGSTLQLAPPCVLLVPPLVVHGFSFTPGTQGHVVSIPADTLARGLGRERLAGARAPRVTQKGLSPEGQVRLATLLSLAADEFAHRRDGRAEALASLAALLALTVARLADHPDDGMEAGSRAGSGAGSDDDLRSRVDRPARPAAAQARLAQAFLAQLEADFRLQPSLTERARRLGVGVPHLSRACRSVLGRSALALVHDRLLLEARRNLVYTSMTVQEIAYALGFSDPAYFSRFFATRAGCAPSVYRNEIARDE